jgi:hypothetical protein
MANVNILNLPVSIAINGAEWLEIVQNGASVRIQAAQITALALGISFPFPISVGGTGATTVAGAQAALGIGTLGLQSAAAAAITGGTITGTAISTGTINNVPVGATTPSTGSFTVVTANSAIAASMTAGAFNYGALSFNDINNIQVMQANVNSYAQILVQNTNSGITASSDIIVCNNNATASTYYGNFGINSSGYTGSGSFNLPNATYFASTSGDLAIGTTTANAIHFVVGGSTTDAMLISAFGNVSIAASIALKAPVTTTAATYTMLATDSTIIYNISATNTTTLLAAASYAGRILFVKNTAAFAVNSASSNVVPLGSTTAGTAILAATAGKFALLQSDGVNWITILAN